MARKKKKTTGMKNELIPGATAAAPPQQPSNKNAKNRRGSHRLRQLQLQQLKNGQHDENDMKNYARHNELELVDHIDTNDHQVITKDHVDPNGDHSHTHSSDDHLEQRKNYQQVSHIATSNTMEPSNSSGGSKKKGGKNKSRKSRQQEGMSQGEQLAATPLEWKQIEVPEERRPIKRGFHTCTLVDRENRLYVIGGDARKTYFNDVWTFDIENQTWTQLPPESSLARPITGHTCTYHNKKIYLFGGKQQERYQSNVLIFDLETRRWRLHRNDRGTKIIPRAAHAAATVGSKWFIFGGIASNNGIRNGGPTRSPSATAARVDEDLVYLNSLILFNLESHEWSIPTVKGTIPQARAGHTFVSVGTDIYLFGGRKGTILLQDFHVLDTTVMRWSRIQTKGDVPPMRAGHTMNAISVNLLLLYGGTDWNHFFHDIYVLDLRDMRWTRIPATGSIPLDRFWHSSVMARTMLYVFGGGNLKIGLFNDLFTLDLAPLCIQDPAFVHTRDAEHTTIQIGDRRPLQRDQSPKIAADESGKLDEGQPDIIKFKIVHEGEVRMSKISRNASFKELHSRLCKEFSSDIVIRYEDDEGDQITIASDENLREAIAFFLDKDKLLRLNIELRSSHEASSPSGKAGYQLTTKLLGRGAFGAVYQVIDKDTNNIIAMKQIDLTMGKGRPNAELIRDVKNEIELLRTLDHPNIVRYLGAELQPDGRYFNIFLEFVPGGSLRGIIDSLVEGYLNEASIRTWTRQILIGLRYLHEKGIIHRDLKASNVLVGDKGCKISDFGHSTLTQEKQGEKNGIIYGTPLWMAPETISNQQYSKSSDVWSLGCTVLEMFGELPWSNLRSKNLSPIQIMYSIGAANEPPPFPRRASAAAKKFLSKCLTIDSEYRASVDELLEEPFIVEKFEEDTFSSEMQQPLPYSMSDSGSSSYYSSLSHREVQEEEESGREGWEQEEEGRRAGGEEWLSSVSSDESDSSYFDSYSGYDSGWDPRHASYQSDQSRFYTAYESMENANDLVDMDGDTGRYYYYYDSDDTSSSSGSSSSRTSSYDSEDDLGDSDDSDYADSTDGDKNEQVDEVLNSLQERLRKMDSDTAPRDIIERRKSANLGYQRYSERPGPDNGDDRLQVVTDHSPRILNFNKSPTSPLSPRQPLAYGSTLHTGTQHIPSPTQGVTSLQRSARYIEEINTSGIDPRLLQQRTMQLRQQRLRQQQRQQQYVHTNPVMLQRTLSSYSLNNRSMGQMRVPPQMIQVSNARTSARSMPPPPQQHLQGAVHHGYHQHVPHHMVDPYAYGPPHVNSYHHSQHQFPHEGSSSSSSSTPLPLSGHSSRRSSVAEGPSNTSSHVVTVEEQQARINAILRYRSESTQPMYPYIYDDRIP